MKLGEKWNDDTIEEGDGKEVKDEIDVYNVEGDRSYR